MFRIDCDRHWSPSLEFHEACDGSTPKLTTGGLVDHMGQLQPVAQSATLVTASLS